MEINKLDELIQLVINLLNKEKTKVIGIKDLESKAKKNGFVFSFDDESIKELCLHLREKEIIAYIQGKGVFKHIRIVD